MWQRFTERARRAILLAQEEAGKMNSSHVGTEHLLLGLLRENEGVAAQVLLQTGLSLALIREEVEDEIDQNDAPAGSEPKLTPRAKRVLELAADEARQMKHNYIGTEHLLLALIREKDGVAAKVLRKLGLDLEKARQQVREYLGPETKEAIPPEHKTYVVMEESEAREHEQKERPKRLKSLDWMLPMLTVFLPRQLREMGRELRSLSKQKELAVLQDDYETAAILRDEANALEKRMEAFAAAWEEKMNEEDSFASPNDSLFAVVARLISETETAIEALSSGDADKIVEIKKRLRSLRDELSNETPDNAKNNSEASVEE